MGKTKRQKNSAQSSVGTDADHKPGTIPNLFFTAVELDTLRLLPGFVGLPEDLPQEELNVAAMPEITRYASTNYLSKYHCARPGVLLHRFTAHACSDC
jgi:hypothetical protein